MKVAILWQMMRMGTWNGSSCENSNCFSFSSFVLILWLHFGITLLLRSWVMDCVIGSWIGDELIGGIT